MSLLVGFAEKWKHDTICRSRASSWKFTGWFSRAKAGSPRRAFEHDVRIFFAGKLFAMRSARFSSSFSSSEEVKENSIFLNFATQNLFPLPVTTNQRLSEWAFLSISNLLFCHYTLRRPRWQAAVPTHEQWIETSFLSSQWLWIIYVGLIKKHFVLLFRNIVL